MSALDDIDILKMNIEKTANALLINSFQPSSQKRDFNFVFVAVSFDDHSFCLWPDDDVYNEI